MQPAALNAYNITSDRLSGIGAWTPAELAQYLSGGHAAGRATASGPMREAVDLSLSKLAPSDIAAMVTYLRTIPAIHSDAQPAPAPAVGASARLGPTDNPIGKRIFQETCASCHAWTGSGAITAEAQLTGRRAVNDPSAVNVAQMILNGAGTPGHGRPYMPAYARSFTDTEIAAVANYVTARFGAGKSHVQPKDVGGMREN